MNVHFAKLFKSVYGPMSNLWLEGQRLVEAGFVIGVEYRQLWFKDKLVLTTDLKASDEDVRLVVQKKVIQSGTNAAIRAEGKRVAETFACDSVKVEYTPGTITITPNTIKHARKVEVLPDPAGVALALAGR